MKRVLLALILSTFFLTAAAQDFEIVSVESLPADMSAREEMKTDHNERQCALLRIATQNIVPEQREKFMFKADLGSEVMERASRNGEIWLWVSPGLKYLRIQHPDLGQYELRFLDYVNRVEALHTYKITIKGTLSLPLQGQGNNTPTQQYLAFRITPANATLFVNDEIWDVSSDGSAVRFVNFGTYNYRVMASNYITQTGTVIVNDPDNTQTVPVNLKPDFVEVTLKVDADAEIWVNNEKKGSREWTGQLGKGTYKIECKQENHETTMVSKEITTEMNGQTITLPLPKPIYGSLNVESSPIGATIFIDGKNMGETPKSINELLIGQHEILLIKDDFTPQYREMVEIVQDVRAHVKVVMAEFEAYAGCYTLFRCNNYLWNYPSGKYVEQVKLRKAVLAAEEESDTSYEVSIFFRNDNYQLPSNAFLIKLRNIAHEANEQGCKLCLTGTGDLGNGSYDQTLSENRCRKIMTELIKMGVPESQIILVPKGGVDPSLECCSRVLIQLLPKPEKTQIVEDGHSQRDERLNQVLPVVSKEIDNNTEKVFTLNDVSFTMKLVEGGTFSMGCSSKNNEDDSWYTELAEAKEEAKPAHNVRVETFYMGETVVTQALWKLVMGNNPSYGKNDNYPVNQVSWNDCQEFIRKLNSLTGKNFRLPTEAEWEYSARGGKNLNGFSDDDNVYDGYIYGHVLVKDKSPNELGLYDMMDNVLQWCGDWYGNYSNLPLDNPQGPFSGLNRVIRGGCRENLDEDFCNYVWSRLGGDPDIAYKFVGFRLCLSE